MNARLQGAIDDLATIMANCPAQVKKTSINPNFGEKCQGAAAAGNAAKCDMEAVLDERVEGDYEEEVKAVQTQTEVLHKCYKTIKAAEDAAEA